jgi:hypothetical protein
MYIYIVTVNIVILYLATRYSDIHNIFSRIYMSTHPAAGRIKYSPQNGARSHLWTLLAVNTRPPRRAKSCMIPRVSQRLARRWDGRAFTDERELPPRKMVSPAPRHDTGEDFCMKYTKPRENHLVNTRPRSRPHSFASQRKRNRTESDFPVGLTLLTFSNLRYIYIYMYI